MTIANLAILWHQHQPYYLDPIRNRFIMPWVRLHAVKDYYGMARVAQQVPECHQTINLVPSLIAQLELYIDGSATDEPLELTRCPADDLSDSERQEILNFFFKANWERMIRPLPRFMELLEKRDPGRRKAHDVADRFSNDDLRDLQLLFNLAWTHPLARTDYPELAELERKERGYTEEDKQVLLAAHDKIIRRVVPLHRELAEQGTLELTTTPFYHPILPLLCHAESAHEAMPGVKLPGKKIDTPEDAREQVARGLAFFEDRFGFRPKGLWPSEGSVSQTILPMLAELGVEWIATDQDILYRSKAKAGSPLEHTSAYGTSENVSIVFRDHKLSDKVGFHYHWVKPDDAVDQFLADVQAAAKASSDPNPLVCVILDGENAWEHYPNSGVDFLHRLYQRAAEDPQINPVTVSEYLEHHPPTRQIKRLHAGSWIDHNFAIWIGHEEDRKAWDYLAEVRAFLVAEGDAHPNVAAAWESLYAAEGSDWFWWYGDDHFSGMDDEFDRLFRLHLKNVYEYLGAESPAFLDVPIAVAPGSKPYSQPVAFMAPTLDGRATNYFEWLPAGRWAPARESGAMEGGAPGLLAGLYFGFDATSLFLRIDALDRVELFDNELGELRIEFVEPANTRLTIGTLATGPSITLTTHPGEGKPVLLDGAADCRAVLDDLLEVAVPFDALGIKAGEAIRFFVEAWSRGDRVEKVPQSGPIDLECPSEAFDQMIWSV